MVAIGGGNQWWQSAVTISDEQTQTCGAHEETIEKTQEATSVNMRITHQRFPVQHEFRRRLERRASMCTTACFTVVLLTFLLLQKMFLL